MMNDKEHLNLTVQAIGNEVGFKSHTTFVTAFKRFTGLTPSNYLALAKTNASVNP
jgi:AraC-like DNA-binding protein